MNDIKGREFIDDADIPWEELGGGLKRKIMAYDDNLMMVKVAFDKGGVGALHSHFHTQMSYVASGVFSITIADAPPRSKQLLRRRPTPLKIGWLDLDGASSPW